MALIGKIRKNSWLLVVLIGLALAAFVIMDMTGSATRGMSNQFTMAEINGEKIDYREFQNAEQILYSGGGGDIFGQRAYLWNYFLEKSLTEAEADGLGLGVSKPELMDLQFGNNLSPVIQQRFSDPNTRQIDRTQLNAIKTQIENNTLEPRSRPFWAFQETEIIKDRLQTKMSAMVAQAIYTPAWMAEKTNENRSATMDLEVIKVPYATIEDSEVEVSDKELMDFLKANKNKYMQDEETRVVEFVSFDVFPTAGDSAQLRQKMEDLKGLFAETTNDSIFIKNHYGTYDAAYSKKEEVSPSLADTFFSVDPGTIIGPYLEGEAFMLAKVLDKMIIPDSVRSRHILRRVETVDEVEAANALIDSIKNEIEVGHISFELAAQRFGTDGTAAKGGDLEFAYPGQMVKPFNDLIFYRAEPGVIYKVYTQFGIHLVEVTDRQYTTNTEGVKVGYIQEDIIPSEETQNEEYDKVLDFVANNRDIESLRQTVSNDLNLRLETSSRLGKNDYAVSTLESGNASRDIIRWAYTQDTRETDVSPEVYIYKHPSKYFNSKYVVAALQTISDGDLPSLSTVRAEIEPLVRNEKKGEILKGRMQGKDLLSLASEYEVDIETAEGVSFSQSFIPAIGNEPKVIGMASGLDVNGVSEPIAGNGGMYVVKLINRNPASPSLNLASVQNTDARTKRNQIRFQLWESLKKNAAIEDNRYTFY